MKSWIWSLGQTLIFRRQNKRRHNVSARAPRAPLSRNYNISHRYASIPHFSLDSHFTVAWLHARFVSIRFPLPTFFITSATGSQACLIRYHRSPHNRTISADQGGRTIEYPIIVTVYRHGVVKFPSCLRRSFKPTPDSGIRL